MSSNTTPDPLPTPYPHPSGGWGSVKKLGTALLQEHVLLKGAALLTHQNKADGFACVSCAWAKPANPHPFEFCESGAKASAWEITSKKLGPDFFARHTLSELESWSDHELEAVGRLTVPLRWDAQSDQYVEVDWDEALAEIGRELRALAPRQAVFYSSGRAALETSYMYQLMVRMYGCNNLPDSSNMCHESTAVALPLTIGVGVGTVSVEDFDGTDCIFFFGQNVGTNSPRMLHQLQDARKRGVPIITFNPLREPGLVSFANPQSPREMLTPAETVISTQYHQLLAGGDSAALMGMCKALVAADDAAVASGAARVLDAAFIAEHCHGFDAFAAATRACGWDEIERESGLARAALEQAATAYAQAGRVIGVYGMGLTQHRNGVQNVQMLSNLLLLRGNIGKPGAGICPIPATERIWETASGRANFIVPEQLAEDPDQQPIGGEVLRLFTVRSDGQFNTTVYSTSDHFRGIDDNRKVLLINPLDLERLGFAAGDVVTVRGSANDGVARSVDGLTLVAYDVPAGCIAGYFPECNPLIPLWHHAKGSMVPAAKSIAVVLRAGAPA